MHDDTTPEESGAEAEESLRDSVPEHDGEFPPSPIVPDGAAERNAASDHPDSGTEEAAHFPNQAVENRDGPVSGDGEDVDEDEDEDDGETEEEEAPGPPLVSIVEAVLFAAREPLKDRQIARAAGKRVRREAVREAVSELNVHYLETGRAFEIAEISGRYQLMSRPEYASHIMRIYPKKDLAEKDKSHRLTPAMLDTLAIIAYKQPVTRADIERIRGVGSGSAVKTLVERGSVKVVGKRTDLIGQPLVYGTTEAFLAEFGLGSLDELPLRNEFIGMLGAEGAEVEYAPTEDAPAAGAESESGGASAQAGEEGGFGEESATV